MEAALLEKASARHRLDVVGGRRCDKRRQVCCGARLVAEVQRHARARPTADVRGIRFSFCTLLAVKEVAWSGQAGVFGESCTRSSSTATQGPVLPENLIRHLQLPRCVQGRSARASHTRHVPRESQPSRDHEGERPPAPPRNNFDFRFNDERKPRNGTPHTHPHTDHAQPHSAQVREVLRDARAQGSQRGAGGARERRAPKTYTPCKCPKTEIADAKQDPNPQRERPPSTAHTSTVLTHVRERTRTSRSRSSSHHRDPCRQRQHHNTSPCNRHSSLSPVRHTPSRPC